MLFQLCRKTFKAGMSAQKLLINARMSDLYYSSFFFLRAEKKKRRNKPILQVLKKTIYKS